MGFQTPADLTQATSEHLREPFGTTILTCSVDDGRTAYNTAMGQANPDFFNFAAGGISSMNLAPGTYFPR